MRLFQTISLALIGWSAPLFADDAFISEEEAGPDFQVQGEYKGEKVGLQVIAKGEGKFDGVLYEGGLPGDGWDGKEKLMLSGETKDGVTVLEGSKERVTISEGKASGEGRMGFEAERVVRKSDTLEMKPPEGAIVLFDGSNVDSWENGKLEEELLGVGTRTKKKFSSYELHLEFRTPFMPKSSGQGRGNSGMYLNDQYECQILDSFGLSGENNECGGFYTLAKPAVNMCYPPLSWQTYDVVFHAAKFSGGKKLKDARVTFKHNGVVIHDDIELPKNTPGGGVSDESEPGAIYLQDHGNPVHFRNIWIKPIE